MRASRSAAGPAPPPSWRKPGPSSESSSTSVYSHPRPVWDITTSDLQRANDFLQPSDRSPPAGASRLVEYCFRAVLEYLNSPELVIAESVIAESEDDEECSLGSIMCEQVGYLEPHLKSGLLEIGSTLPPMHPGRLSDTSLKAILSRPGQKYEDIEPPDQEDWEEETMSSAPDAGPSLHHLPLTIHDAPANLLRHIPHLSAISLTSLNLAYSKVSDLDRLVHVLPPGLRDLSFRGVLVRGGDHTAMEREAWRRGLSALGRKLIVLRVSPLY